MSGDAERAGMGFATGGLSEVGGLLGSSNSPQIMPFQIPGLMGLSSDIAAKSSQLLKNGFGTRPDLKVLGFNPYEQVQLDKLKALFASPNPLTSQASQYTSDVLGGKYLDPASNPALAKYADAISGGAQRFLNSNLDQLSSNFALAGGTSSSAMANAKARATQDVSGQVGQQLAALYSNAYGNERGLQQNVLGQAQSLAQEPMSRYMAALGLGGQERQLSQGQSDIGYTNYLNEAQAQAMPLQLALQSLQGINSTYRMPQYAPSQMSQNLGLLFQGANSAGNLMKGMGAMG